MRTEVNTTVNKWKNKEEFKKQVYHFAHLIGVEIKSICVRSMTNKWASCSTNGNLNFNLKLLEMDRKIGDYVIVHEILHFRVPNHGRLWKSLMRLYLNDYKEVESKLFQLPCNLRF